MKILISTDIEGIAGLFDRSLLDQSKPTYEQVCELLTKEINIVAKACFDAGATHVVIADGHGAGKNILIDQLDSRVTLYNEKKGPLSMMDGVQETDFTIFLGYHGMAGKENSFCAHTNSTITVAEVKLNNIPVSEGHINAMIAKHFNNKVILSLGTNNSAQELAPHIPTLPTLTVKESINFHTAKENDTEKVYNDIKHAVTTAIASIDQTQHITWDTKNVEWTIKVTYPFLLNGMGNEYQKVDERTVTIPATDIHTGFLTYRKLLKHISKEHKYSFYK